MSGVGCDGRGSVTCLAHEFDISPFAELCVAHDEVRKSTDHHAKRSKVTKVAARKPARTNDVGNHHRVFERVGNCIRVPAHVTAFNHAFGTQVSVPAEVIDTETCRLRR